MRVPSSADQPLQTMSPSSLKLSETPHQSPAETVGGSSKFMLTEERDEAAVVGGFGARIADRVAREVADVAAAVEGDAGSADRPPAPARRDVLHAEVEAEAIDLARRFAVDLRQHDVLRARMEGFERGEGGFEAAAHVAQGATEAPALVDGPGDCRAELEKRGLLPDGVEAAGEERRIPVGDRPERRVETQAEGQGNGELLRLPGGVKRGRELDDVMRPVGPTLELELVHGRLKVEAGLELEAFEPGDAGRVVAHGGGVVGAGDEGAGLGGAAAAVLKETEAGGGERSGDRRQNRENTEEERASLHGLRSLSLGTAALR